MEVNCNNYLWKRLNFQSYTRPMCKGKGLFEEKKVVRYLKNIYYSKKNQNTYHYKLSSQKFDKIDLLDLQTKSEYICNNLNLKKVNIREIYPGLYRFECK